jgi:hypothetical protein
MRPICSINGCHSKQTKCVFNNSNRNLCKHHKQQSMIRVLKNYERFGMDHISEIKYDL